MVTASFLPVDDDIQALGQIGWLGGEEEEPLAIGVHGESRDAAIEWDFASKKNPGSALLKACDCWPFGSERRAILTEMPFTWYFRLEGDDLDVQTLKDLFKESAILQTLEDGRHHIVIELPFTLSEARSALGSAEELLSKLNGIAQAIHGNHENVRVGAVSCRETPDGPLNRLILTGTGRIRLRGGLCVVVTSGHAPGSTLIQKSMGDSFLEVANRDKHFERALYLYGSLPQDWRGLYMVLEAAEDGNGGEKGLIARDWVSDGVIKDFKATANSFKALGLQARHGSVCQGVHVPKQTLDDAREMIRAILERWRQDLSKATSGEGVAEP